MVGHLNRPGTGWPPYRSAEVEARQQVLVIESTHGGTVLRGFARTRGGERARAFGIEAVVGQDGFQ